MDASRAVDQSDWNHQEYEQRFIPTGAIAVFDHLNSPDIDGCPDDGPDKSLDQQLQVFQGEVQHHVK